MCIFFVLSGSHYCNSRIEKEKRHVFFYHIYIPLSSKIIEDSRTEDIQIADFSQFLFHVERSQGHSYTLYGGWTHGQYSYPSRKEWFNPKMIIKYNIRLSSRLKITSIMTGKLNLGIFLSSGWNSVSSVNHDIAVYKVIYLLINSKSHLLACRIHLKIPNSLCCRPIVC